MYRGLPAVTTCWAEPVPAGMTACRDLVWSQPILSCVPVRCHSWGLGQQRVVFTQTVVSAERASAVNILPVADRGRPFVRKPTRTLVATPPHTQTTAGCDLPASQELVFGMMPLPLQLWPEQADVWACSALSILVPAHPHVGCCPWTERLKTLQVKMEVQSHTRRLPVAFQLWYHSVNKKKLPNWLSTLVK